MIQKDEEQARPWPVYEPPPPWLQRVETQRLLNELKSWALTGVVAVVVLAFVLVFLTVCLGDYARTRTS